MTPRRIVLSLFLTGCIAASSLAQEGAKGPTVRPEVGKPIQAAVDLLRHRRGREALAKAREAQAVPNKTAYESYVVERVLGQAAVIAGEHAAAAHALELAATSAGAPEGERRQVLAAAVAEYYALKDYGKTSELAGRYIRDGGGDRAVRTLYAQSLYLSNNFAAAAKALAAEIETDEHAGRAPPEDQLQILASAYDKQRDSAGYARTMERLVAYYPKKDYWLSVLYSVTARPGYSDRLAIDLARLKRETGTMRTAAEYLEAAQLSLQEGFPVEAVQVIDQGYAAGLLGTGPEAERHKRLKDLAAKALAEDRQTMSRDSAQAAAGKDGKTLFNDGFNYVLNGNSAKGLEMMEQGLKLGSGFRRLDHAKLQLGYAYHLGGQNQKAIQAFKKVQGDDGALALAKLWMIRLSHSS